MTKFSTERLATLDSPVFTGDVRAPTPSPGDSDTSLATTAFVAGGGGGFTTGDAKITLKTVPDTGWIMMNDGSIGSGASGASYANVLAQALFILIFNNVSDTAAPIQTSAGAATTRAAQGNAAAAWTANCRLFLTKQLGRSIAIAGAGAGLTSRPLGAAAGAETESPTITNMANHYHVNAGHNHGIPSGSILVDAGATYTIWSVTAPNMTNYTLNAQADIQATGGGAPLNILDPKGYWNVMIKL